MIVLVLAACGDPEPRVRVVHERAAPVGDVSLGEADVQFHGVVMRLGSDGIAAGDVDLDGLVDIAASEFGFVWLWRSSSGSLLHVEGKDSVALADVLGGPEAELLLGQSIANPIPRAATGAPAVDVLDLSGDEPLLAARLSHVAYYTSGSQDYEVTALAQGVAIDGEASWAGPGTGIVWWFERVEGDLELDADADARWIGPADHAAARVTGSAELDGDGQADALVQLDGRYAGADAVIAAIGQQTDQILDPDVLPSLVDVGNVATGGDIDGDGIDDIVAAGDGEARLLLGPFAGRTGSEAVVATLLPVGWPELPITTAAIARDVDGDGFDDLLAGALDDVGNQAGGVVAVWYGPVEGERLLNEADARLLGEAPGDQAGRHVLGPGDTDGDGYGDIVVAAPERGEGGAVYILSGGAPL